MLHDSHAQYNRTTGLAAYVVIDLSIYSVVSCICILFAAFVIKFGKDSPMVNGDQVFISFLSSAPVVSAMCSLTTQPTVDCEYSH